MTEYSENMIVRKGIEKRWKVSVILRKSYSSQKRLKRRKLRRSSVIEM